MPTNEKRVYQWVIGLLAAALLTLGGASGTLLTTATKADTAAVSQALSEHVERNGHPVMVERVARLEQYLQQEFLQINTKLNTLLAQ